MKTISLTIGTSLFLSILICALLFTNAFVFSNRAEASPKTVYSNTAPIIINTFATPTPNPSFIPASPYPSTINVSGLTGTTTKVTASLRGFTQKVSRGLDLLLVSPTGQKFILLSDIGNSNYPVNDVDITFDDDAPTQYPSDGVIYSGTYRPRNLGSGDTFPAPAPAPPYNSSLDSTLGATFSGADPNGNWSLYVVNQGSFSDEGRLNLGWSLNVTTTGSPATAFANANYLEISWLKAKAAPFGSIINVSGTSGVISNLRVSLNGITHTRTQDIDVLLVSPSGTGLILMGDIGSGGAANVNLTLDAAAPQILPDQQTPLTSGTYRPQNNNSFFVINDSDTFLAPAPLEPYLYNNLDGFKRINPNGNWTLYVMDDSPGDSGMIAGGWSLDITTAPFVPAQIGCTVPTLSLSDNFGVGIGPTHLAVGDFDNSNGPDLVVTNQASNSVTVLLNNGSGDFTNQTLLTPGSSPYAVAVSNFNGDANQDLAVINSFSNNVSIFLGNGNGTFSTAVNFAVGASPISVAAGDFNNDTNQDLAVANFGGFFSGTVSLLFGNGTGGFSTPTTLRTRTQPSYVAVGNFNADSLPDLAVATFGTDSVAIFLNSGNGTFSLNSNVSVGAGPVFIEVADLGNDGIADLQVANFNSDSISLRYGNGNGTFSGTTNNPVGLNPTAVVSGDFTQNNQGIQTAAALSGSNNVKFLQGSQVATGMFPNSLVKGDFDGDGKLDLATANSDSNSISVLLNSCRVAKGNRFDFNADRRTDYSVFRAAQSAWFSNSFSTPTKFAKPTDTLVPADYDGDGDTDYAIYRPESGLWYAVDVVNNPIHFLQFGLPTDIPVPADFDGDTKADIAVWRPSDGTWYVRRSSDHSLLVAQFGMNGDRPAAADFDGDGRADLGIFRPSTGVWYILRSGDNGFTILQFGIDTDKILPADYDGDGKADVAVWRPSTGVWYILRSTDGGFTIIGYGMNGDVPVQGDFEGDGRFDLAVYRPNEGVWYVLRSSDNISSAYNYGISTDFPLPAAFVR